MSPIDLLNITTVINNIRYLQSAEELDKPLTKEEQEFIEWLVNQDLKKRGM